jgi:hypothetical protein
MDAKAEYVLSFIKGFNSKLYWCFESDLLSRVYDTIQKAEKLAVASLVEENITPSRFGCTVYRLNELAEIKENTTYRDESGASTYTYAGNYVFIASGLEQGLYYVNSAEDYMKIKDISTRKFNQQLSILENTTKAYDCSLGIKNQDTFITLTNEQLGTLVQKSEKLEIKNFQDNSPSVLLPHLAKPVLSQADLLNIGKKQEVRFLSSNENIAVKTDSAVFYVIKYTLSLLAKYPTESISKDNFQDLFKAAFTVAMKNIYSIESGYALDTAEIASQLNPKIQPLKELDYSIQLIQTGKPAANQLEPKMLHLYLDKKNELNCIIKNSDEEFATITINDANYEEEINNIIATLRQAEHNQQFGRKEINAIYNIASKKLHIRELVKLERDFLAKVNYKIPLPPKAYHVWTGPENRKPEPMPEGMIILEKVMPEQGVGAIDQPAKPIINAIFRKNDQLEMKSLILNDKERRFLQLYRAQPREKIVHYAEAPDLITNIMKQCECKIFQDVCQPQQVSAEEIAEKHLTWQKAKKITDATLKMLDKKAEQFDKRALKAEKIEKLNKTTKTSSVDYKEAATTTRALRVSLEKEVHSYLYVKGAAKEDAAAFKESCDQLVQASKPVLIKHREGRRILKNLGLAFATLFIGYAVASAVNKIVTGEFMFFAETDSERLLKKAKKNIQVVARLAASAA